MNARFAQIVATMEPKLQELLATPPVTAAALPRDFPAAGVYLFSEHGKHLYVGRSNDLRFWIQTHVRPSAATNQAAFAYRLARQVAGIVKVAYKKLTPEEDWSLREPFLSAFPASKQRIRQMELRAVSEPDPLAQMILEVYVAVALDAPHNDFDNH